MVRKIMMLRRMVWKIVIKMIKIILVEMMVVKIIMFMVKKR